MINKEYHKIETLFERSETTKKLIEGKFRNPAVEYIQHNQWQFTEKIDGTNIRIFWDGHAVKFSGRTDKAQMPVKLNNRLDELFGGEVNAQMFEQKFGEKPVLLVGEGYGAGIQKGGVYKANQDFMLFDIMIDNLWLERKNVEDIAKYFSIEAVPIIMTGTIQQAVDYVKAAPKSLIGTAKIEGLVGRPIVEMYDRRGKRVIVKIKVRDFE